MQDIRKVDLDVVKEFESFGELGKIVSKVPFEERWNWKYVDLVLDDREKVESYFNFFTENLESLTPFPSKKYYLFAEHAYYFDNAESSLVKIVKPIELKIFNEKNLFELSFSFEYLPENYETISCKLESKTAPTIYSRFFEGKLDKTLKIKDLTLTPDKDDFTDSLCEYISEEKRKNLGLKKLLDGIGEDFYSKDSLFNHEK